MNLLQALILGIVEGITEFLPVSSTGHLTIVEKLLGLKVDDQGVTAFTAIIQVGAILAVIIFFRSDIARLFLAWIRGLGNRRARDDPDYRLAWYVILGSIPIGIVGFLAKDLISGGLRNLWVVVAALILWSIVMWAAERVATQKRDERNVTLVDAIVIGLFQCIALISASVGWIPTILATIVSLVVAYAAIAWLLRIVARHPITIFIWYRIGLAVVVAALLLTGVITAT
jgi:undecaprenyl-diphosphatase